MNKIILLLLCPVLFASSVFAAPPFNPSMAEPPEYPGVKLQERLARTAPSGMMLAPISVPSSTINILFLRVDFQPDTDSQTAGTGEWSDSTYGGNTWVDNAKIKFPEYWKEVSYGLLPISVEVSPSVYRLNYALSHYGSETYSAIENLIYDSITAAAADPNIIFSTYDAVLIVHAGVGEETDVYGSTPDDIWSLYYGTSSSAICQNASSPCLSVKLRNNVDITEAIIMPQTDSRSEYSLVIDPLGVYVHEFGHWLGLPDLYCTSYDCVGAGMWSLMADGSYNRDSGGTYGAAPAHLDAWSLYDLGWVVPQVVSSATQSMSITLNPVETVPAPATPAAGTYVYKAQASTSTQSQYFLMENRQNIGFDAGLPGKGLLVWLVDEDIISANRNSNTVNYYPSRLGVKLIEADGDWSLLQSGSLADTGSAGDPFPGSSNNTKLTPMTDPSSVPYTNYGWMNVRNISAVSNAINFTIGFGPLPPTGLAINRSTGTLSWTASNGAAEYHIYKNGNRSSYVNAGNFTSYTDGACQTTDTYAVTAVDASENESQAALITPVLTVTPLSLSLSDTVVSGTLTLSNSGNADLAIQSIALSGAGQSYFSYSSACGSTVATGSSCAITVTFSPTSTGTKSATLSLSTNDIQNPTVAVSLTGSVSSSSSSSSQSLSSHGCFIATAAYGSYLDPRVQVLREFRDRYLLTNSPGRAAVSFYYQHSPALAAYIGRHEGLRTITRCALTPVVLAAAYPSFAAAVVVGLGGVVLMRRRRNRTKRS